MTISVIQVWIIAIEEAFHLFNLQNVSARVRDQSVLCQREKQKALQVDHNNECRFTRCHLDNSFTCHLLWPGLSTCAEWEDAVNQGPIFWTPELLAVATPEKVNLLFMLDLRKCPKRSLDFSKPGNRTRQGLSSGNKWWMQQSKVSVTFLLRLLSCST